MLFLINLTILCHVASAKVSEKFHAAVDEALILKACFIIGLKTVIMILD